MSKPPILIALVLALLVAGPVGALMLAPIDNVSSHWKCDEASGDRADSHGAVTLTDLNTVLAGTAKVGTNSCDFESSGSEALSTNDAANLSAGAGVSFAIAAWVNLESQTTDHTIVSKWHGGTNNREWVLHVGNTADRFQFLVSAAGSATSGSVSADNFGAVGTGTWHFVVGWHDAVNDEIGIQVDGGTANTTAYASDVFDSGSTFRVGALGNNASYFDGLIDSVTWWHGGVPTAQDRLDMYNSGAGLEYPFTVSGGKPPCVIGGGLVRLGCSGDFAWRRRQ